MKKGETIVYDIQSCPDGIRMERIFNIWKESKWLLWDSSNNSNEPKLLNGETLEFSLDISVPENRELVEKLMKELGNG